METKELLLKTAFCCMACDGDIANEEINIIKQYAQSSTIFEGFNVEETLNNYISQITAKGKAFLSEYIEEVSKQKMTEEEQLQLVKLAFDIIEADNNIEYSEISFFKRIRQHLTISDDAILEKYPDKEDYLLPDIISDDDLYDAFSFENITLSL